MGNLKKSDNQDYGYYSKLLGKPFDTLPELRAAEDAEIQRKAEKAAAATEKKQLAEAVENAYKALNTAKREYKIKLDELLTKHAKALSTLQEEFAKEKDALIAEVSAAETNYKNKLQAFTDKHPEGFHITLKDGDYETSISSHKSTELTTPTIGDWLISTFFNNNF